MQAGLLQGRRLARRAGASMEAGRRGAIVGRGCACAKDRGSHAVELLCCRSANRRRRATARPGTLHGVHNSPGTFGHSPPSDNEYAQAGRISSWRHLRDTQGCMTPAAGRGCTRTWTTIRGNPGYSRRQSNTNGDTRRSRCGEILSMRTVPEAVFLPTFDEGVIDETASHRKAARNEPPLLQSSHLGGFRSCRCNR